MGRKNSKGAVSIINDRGRIRLRWRYQDKRYSINLSFYNKTNLLQARKISLSIEQDIATDRFDQTLVHYIGETEKRSIVEKSIVAYFEEWVSFYKQMDCEKHTNYNSTRGMLKKWGDIQEGNIQKKLSQLPNAAVTYNRRLTVLKSFAKWLVKKGVWIANPL